MSTICKTNYYALSADGTLHFLGLSIGSDYIFYKEYIVLQYGKDGKKQLFDKKHPAPPIPQWNDFREYLKHPDDTSLVSEFLKKSGFHGTVAEFLIESQNKNKSRTGFLPELPSIHRFTKDEDTKLTAAQESVENLLRTLPVGIHLKLFCKLKSGVSAQVATVQRTGEKVLVRLPAYGEKDRYTTEWNLATDNLKNRLEEAVYAVTGGLGGDLFGYIGHLMRGDACSVPRLYALETVSERIVRETNEYIYAVCPDNHIMKIGEGKEFVGTSGGVETHFTAGGTTEINVNCPEIYERTFDFGAEDLLLYLCDCCCPDLMNLMDFVHAPTPLAFYLVRYCRD